MVRIFKSLPLIAEEYEQNGATRGFNTLAEFNAVKSTIPSYTVVTISEAGANQGLNVWNGTTLTKSAYDPLTQAKADATTKANAAQAAAITAAQADASTKANAAQQAAAVDATTKAITAQANAIATAATDATTKANTAKSEAITAAATDATTKANTAKSEAISAAATDATAKANAAEANAKNYADENKARYTSVNVENQPIITDGQAKIQILTFWGTLTKDTEVIFPNHTAYYVLHNSTTMGGFKLTVKTEGQTAPAVEFPATSRKVVFNTGSNILMLVMTKQS